MAITSRKFVESDFDSRKIAALSDTPSSDGMTAAQLKAYFDYMPKTMIAMGAINGVIDDLVATTDGASGADQIGATAVGTGEATTVQGILEEIHARADMLKSVYDTDNDGIVDNAEKLGGQLPSYYGTQAEVTLNTNARHTHSNKALLDTYTQTEADIADAISKEHTHSNKALLDTYAQTETNLADAVSKKHEHSNKALLDTYTQTEADIADAIAKEHTHSNKSLLDSYTQTESDLSDAVAKKHEHANKSLLDGISANGTTGYYLKKTESGTEWADIGGAGLGDMMKSVYDTDDDGIVDNAEKLGGQLPSYYGTQAEVTLNTNSRHSHSNKNILDAITTAPATTETYSNISLEATNWTSQSGYVTKDVTVSGILATDTPILDLVATTSGYEDEQDEWAKIFKVSCAANTLTFYASEAITTALTLVAKVVR